jgi:hypothetical protein
VLFPPHRNCFFWPIRVKGVKGRCWTCIFEFSGTVSRQAGRLWIIDVAYSRYKSTWLSGPHELRAHVSAVMFRVLISKWLDNHFVFLRAMRESRRDFLQDVSNSVFLLAQKSTKLYPPPLSFLLFNDRAEICCLIEWGERVISTQEVLSSNLGLEVGFADRLRPFKSILLPLASIFVYFLIFPMCCFSRPAHLTILNLRTP